MSRLPECRDLAVVDGQGDQGGSAGCHGPAVIDGSRGVGGSELEVDGHLRKVNTKRERQEAAEEDPEEANSKGESRC